MDAVIGGELDKLTGHVTKLTAQIKEKQIRLAQIAAEVQQAQEQAVVTIKDAQDRMQARQDELLMQLAPLEERVAQLQSAHATHVDLHQTSVQARQDELRSLKAEKLSALAALEQQITERLARLDGIQIAIAQCQQRVAAL